MTVREAYSGAMALLGETGGAGLNNQPQTVNRILAIVNAVYADLYTVVRRGQYDFHPVHDIDDVIWLPRRVCNDCLLYGVAMHIAMGEDDANRQAVMASLYNQKRAVASRISKVKDVYGYALSDDE